MCGILGILGAPPAFAQKLAIPQARKLQHRGPDEFGSAFHGGSGLCHCRLSIVDPIRGSQPFARSDGAVSLVANAAIYNHRELRCQLQHEAGVQFETENDCEVLLHAYLHWGEAFLDRLDGFFAIIILDHRDGTGEPKLIAARDAVGVTSLFVSVCHMSDLGALEDSAGPEAPTQFLLLGSELKSLCSSTLALSDGPKESPFVTDCVATFPPGHWICTDAAQVKDCFKSAQSDLSFDQVDTTVKGSRPATNGQAGDFAAAWLSQLGLRRFFQPAWYHGGALQSWEQNLDLASLRKTVCAAVRKRLMSDVPIAFLLSGGLDSSLVCLAASEYLDELRSEPKPFTGASAGFARPITLENLTNEDGRLRTYTVGVVDTEGKVSGDILAARQVAAHLGTHHTEVLFTAEEGFKAISECIYHIESFDVSTVRSSIPLLFLSERIRTDGIKVLLSGEGSDEIFGGYTYLGDAPTAEAFHEECVSLLRNVHLTDVTRINKIPMARSIETRAPLVDRALMDEVFAIHPGYKMFLRRNESHCQPDSPRPGWKRCDGPKEAFGAHRLEKAILRAAFDPFLNPQTPQIHRTIPQEVLWRKKEQFSDGVGVSWAQQLREHAERKIDLQELEHASTSMMYLAPRTAEELLYRRHFQALFGSDGRPELTVVRWQAGIRFGRGGDPSGHSQ